MKQHIPHRDQLGELLQEWRIEAELPPRFEEQVWRRIAVGEARSHEARWWPRFRVLLEALFVKPAFATACVLAFLLAGTAAGWVRGQHEIARLDDTLAARYVQSVDPYATPHHQ